MFRVANETTNQTVTLTTGGQWSNWTDEELLLEYRCTGIRETFDELVYRYERELYNYLYRYLGHSANAEDVFQKTFLAVLEKCDKFDADRKFRPWLYTIATNEAINHLRKEKRFSVVSIDAPAEEGRYPLADIVEGNAPAPFEEPMDREIAQKVREAVDSLPEKMKRAVYLVYFQGLNYREAADEVGVHFMTLSQRLKGAVGKLNYMLKTVG
jgi:RNA polymerase sigma-70 factor (ECF subfamily)